MTLSNPISALNGTASPQRARKYRSAYRCDMELRRKALRIGFGSFATSVPQD